LSEIHFLVITDYKWLLGTKPASEFILLSLLLIGHSTYTE